MGNRLSAYRDALEYLFVRTTGQWRFGLERTRALLAELGDPHLALRAIHVGGTNGKGSVCATLDTVLRARGFRVARYTSPHLVDFRERIMIDGAPVDEEQITEFIAKWTPTIERIGATFFEATTAMAFSLFQQANPDIAIVEVGLGGRLDSTNVIDPMLAVVTNIGVDHTEYLGDSRADIAFEKAGIFKPGRVAVIGEREPMIRDLLAARARAAGAAPVDLAQNACDVRDIVVDASGTSFTAAAGATRVSVHTPLVGRYQAFNTAVALRVLELLPPPWSTNPGAAAPHLRGVSLAGRFDRRGQHVFDVAHNPDGAGVLARALADVNPPRPRAAVLSVLRDKDWRAMMQALAPQIDQFVLTVAPTSPANRVWNPQEALLVAGEEGWNAVLEPDFGGALRRADAFGATVLITGSFHTVGDAMLRLHLSPLGG